LILETADIILQKKYNMSTFHKMARFISSYVNPVFDESRKDWQKLPRIQTKSVAKRTHILDMIRIFGDHLEHKQSKSICDWNNNVSCPLLNGNIIDIRINFVCSMEPENKQVLEDLINIVNPPNDYKFAHNGDIKRTKLYIDGIVIPLFSNGKRLCININHR
jgi:hypothetical protein